MERLHDASRGLDALIDAFQRVCEGSPRRFFSPLGEVDGSLFPRVAFFGQDRTREAPRIGLVAGLSAADTLGPQALLEFFERVALQPNLAAGFNLLLYPLSNLRAYRDVAEVQDLLAINWARELLPETTWLVRELHAYDFSALVLLAPGAPDGTLRIELQGHGAHEAFVLAQPLPGQRAGDYTAYPFPVEWVPQDRRRGIGPSAVVEDLATPPAILTLRYPGDWEEPLTRLALGQTLRVFLSNYRSQLSYGLNL